MFYLAGIAATASQSINIKYPAVLKYYLCIKEYLPGDENSPGHKRPTTKPATSTQAFQNLALDSGKASTICTDIILASKIGYESSRIPPEYIVTPNSVIMESDPILGLVDNMSYFTGDDNKNYNIFGDGGVEKVAKEFDKKFLGKIPIDVDLRKSADEGQPLFDLNPKHKISTIYKEIAQKVKQSF